MPADRSIPKEAWLSRPLEHATAAALSFPRITLAVAAVLAVAALLLAGLRLGYKTGRLDLLDPKSDYNRLWTEHCEEFGEADDAVVVVEGPSPERVESVLEELSEGLAREDHLFHAVLQKVDLSKIQAKGLHYLSPRELQGIEQFLEQAAPIVAGQWSQLNVAGMASGLQTRLEASARGGAVDPAVADQAERLSAGLVAALGQGNRYQSPWPPMPSSFDEVRVLADQRQLANDRRRGLILLRLAPGEDSFARGSEAIDKLRALIAGVQARHEGTQIGLTGLPVLENDEMRSSSRTMFWASVLSFLGVALLFVAGFGGVRHALLANLVLLVGMAWAFGYATLAVGHLNILSVSFTVTLIGIGIDYGIHYISRYLQLRRDGQDCREALLAASRSVGPAIVTGAITTAIAFFAAALTSFTGIAELGLIAGGGLLLCAVAMLFVLPAALLLVDQAGGDARLPQPWPVHRWLAPLADRPRRTLAITLASTLLVAWGLNHLVYDHNLLNLQAESLESVKLERKLLAESKQSSWYAVSMAGSREELLARKENLLTLASVERVEEIVSLLPAANSAKQPIIERIQNKLVDLPQEPPAISVDHPADVSRVLEGTSRLAAGLVSPVCARQMEQARDALRRLPAAQCYESLAKFQQQMAHDLLGRLQLLKSMANPQPPSLDDLPPALVARFVGQHQRHLMKICGRGELWDMPNLSRFVADVRSVDPRATGHPLLAYEASREMKRSYEQAALYALAVILVVLILDFRDARLALLAAAPLGLGVVQMFGLLGLLNIPLNPANLIALPLILGIGIDYGVHIVHEYAACAGRYRLSASTAVAVLVDSLTTIVGFGSLLIATHRGLASLGLVLSIGVACCLFTSLVMLPALLAWLTRGREQEAPPTSPSVGIDVAGEGGARPQSQAAHQLVEPHWETARRSVEHRSATWPSTHSGSAARPDSFPES